MIIGPKVNREKECEAILRSLPEWFGIEDSLQMYARDSGTLPTFAFTEEDKLVGFISLVQHFPESWEVHCIAVHARRRNTGIGSHLLKYSENWLSSQGVKYIQIKTVADSVDDANYAQTREFYLRKGYTPVEVFPTIWHPGCPALQLIKKLQ